MLLDFVVFVMFKVALKAKTCLPANTETPSMVMIAVILENFMEVTSGDSATIDEEKLNEFVEVWTKLDPDAGSICKSVSTLS